MTGGGMIPMAPGWTPGYAALMLGMWTVMTTLAGLVVAAVGVYQLTPLKRACLERCRALDGCLAGVPPRRAQDTGRAGPRYGVSCLGCCAALMGLLFVGGLMNVVWMAAIAGWVLAEKALPWGGRIARLGAAGLIAGGTAAFAIALAHG